MSKNENLRDETYKRLKEISVVPINDDEEASLGLFIAGASVLVSRDIPGRKNPDFGAWDSDYSFHDLLYDLGILP